MRLPSRFGVAFSQSLLKISARRPSIEHRYRLILLGRVISLACLGFVATIENSNILTPCAIGEPVRLIAYELAGALLGRARTASCGASKAERGCHRAFGSTAVPDMPAKPSVDIMIGVAALPPDVAMERALLASGYVSFAEAGVPGRFHFRLTDIDRSFDVHVVERGGRHWRSSIALGDYLREDAGARAQCADAKRTAIGGGFTAS